MFPLCRTCAESLQQTPCEHADEKRMLSGTWCSIDIDKALELGYRVVRMIEVWHFPQKSSELFTGYIDTFLKIKQEASGWPSWCETENNSTSKTMKGKKVSSWTMERLRRTLDYVHWPS